MKDKNRIDSFLHFGRMASNYGNEYREVNNKEGYLARRYRLDRILSILERVKPKKILDVGCGNAKPLIEMLNKGFNVKGFDYSKEMIEEAKKNLKASGYPADLVHRNNMENIKWIEPNEFDCIVALGSLYYARDFNKTIKNLSSLLQKDGHFIFSLRNELFSLFSMNKYSLLFFWQKLIPNKYFSEATKKKIYSFLSERFKNENIKHKFKTIDDLKVHSILHNPLTVNREVLEPNNLKLEELLFYHYHSMPPIFEHILSEEFRTTSAKLENPRDWRGLFMASAFIVHSRKQK